PRVQVPNSRKTAPFYRAQWFMESSVVEPDSAVQFRLRINQVGAWSAWDRVINSYLNAAPSSGSPKVYPVFFNPRVTGNADNEVIFSFDITSFAIEDDTSSWLWLNELVVEEVTITTTTEVLRYDFTDGDEGWVFQSEIYPFDSAIYETAPGFIAISANGSANCFSYWASPGAQIEDNKLYLLVWEVGSFTSNPDDTVQFRLRANQFGRWSGWDRIVNSFLQNAPSVGNTKRYDILLSSDVTGTLDNQLVLSLDIISMDPNDDTSSSLFLDSVCLQEALVNP
ncbi:MAG: hypothetical protein N2246_02115, partial [Candidatus Sumerlaeia bacterium]|nr:hypothetical protein [Candidatus Sumerlaeia bacterium]